MCLFTCTLCFASPQTPLYEQFRKDVDAAQATVHRIHFAWCFFEDSLACEQGDTALYDSLALACDKLVEWQSTHQTAALRVVCLSDGKV